MSRSFFNNHKQRSPLLQQKRIRSQGGPSTSGKSLLFNMNLTTLIDAFCILVIFLLSNMNGQLQNLQIGKNMMLPAAVGTEVLSTGVVVRMELNELFVDDKKIAVDGLVKTLLEKKSAEKNSLIIQADKNSDYDRISLLLRAGAQAGYEKYAFAVLPGTYAGKE
jgi:biopolymer transport protein ExbD